MLLQVVLRCITTKLGGSKLNQPKSTRANPSQEGSPLAGNMHRTRAVLHTFAGKLGREGDGEAPRGDSKRSKDTNLAPTRPGIGKEARKQGWRGGGAGFLCQQSNKRRVRRGGVGSENAHALHKIYQVSVQVSAYDKQKLNPLSGDTSQLVPLSYFPHSLLRTASHGTAGTVYKLAFYSVQLVQKVWTCFTFAPTAVC